MAQSIQNAIIRGNLNEVLRLFEQAPSLVNYMVDGEIPLHFACRYGHKDIVIALLKRGSLVNFQNNHGRSPLHIAAYMGYDEIVEILLQHKADTGIKDFWGETPLHDGSCANNLKIIKLLVKYGASANVVNDRGAKPRFYSNHKACREFLLLAENIGSLWELWELTPNYENLIQWLPLERMIVVVELYFNKISE